MRKGNRTIQYQNVYVLSGSSVVGPKEKQSPFAPYFDLILDDDTLSEQSYERAESLMQFISVQEACKKFKAYPDDLDCVLAGDLVNQITSSTFSARKISGGFLGLYGACSTFGEALTVGSLLIDTGSFEKVACATSSHFSTAERQYRYPLELGTSMTPTSQRTVTAAGTTVLATKNSFESSVLNKTGVKQKITFATIGSVIDFGVLNSSNMGGAMAPAAFDTFYNHLTDTGKSPSDYDLIMTGDLGIFGSSIFEKLCLENKIELKNYRDGGAEFFGRDNKMKMGGSGAGCINAVFNSYILKKMQKCELNKVLIIPTGALLSQDSPLQKETIPAIAYAVSIENTEE